MPVWTEIVIALIGVLGACSTGILGFIQYKSNRKWEQKLKEAEKKSNQDEMLLSISRYHIVTLCEEPIDRGYITQKERDFIIDLYKPYRKCGGNGKAEADYNTIIRLPVKNKGDDEDVDE